MKACLNLYMLVILCYSYKSISISQLSNTNIVNSFKSVSIIGENTYAQIEQWNNKSDKQFVEDIKNGSSLTGYCKKDNLQTSIFSNDIVCENGATSNIGYIINYKLCMTAGDSIKITTEMKFRNGGVILGNGEVEYRYKAETNEEVEIASNKYIFEKKVPITKVCHFDIYGLDLESDHEISITIEINNEIQTLESLKNRCEIKDNTNQPITNKPIREDEC